MAKSWFQAILCFCWLVSILQISNMERFIFFYSLLLLFWIVKNLNHLKEHTFGKWSTIEVMENSSFLQYYFVFPFEMGQFFFLPVMYWLLTCSFYLLFCPSMTFPFLKQLYSCHIIFLSWLKWEKKKSTTWKKNYPLVTIQVNLGYDR